MIAELREKIGIINHNLLSWKKANERKNF